MPLDVVQAAQVAEAAEIAQPVVVDEADDLVAEMSARRETLHDDPAEVVAADDQHPLDADTALM